MEFELEYESNVIKNRNLFYFNNYCNNYFEFEEWLKHNEICMIEFEDLNQELKEIYINKIENYIVETFKTFQNDIVNIGRKERIERFKIIYYDIWLKYYYIINNYLKSNNMKTIKEWIIENQDFIMRYIGIN